VFFFLVANFLLWVLEINLTSLIPFYLLITEDYVELLGLNYAISYKR